MEIVRHAAELRARVAAWRRAGDRVGFVPTMGNLHAGHYSLLAVAREHARRVVASIFVNPTQFGPHEDFASYPRTLEQDSDGLRARGCDLLFAPEVGEVYPYGAAASVRIEVPEVSAPLEGAMRPGHFSGVATVVAKLFNLVQPDVAVFGRKDYQQLLVIRRLVRDLALPIEICEAPTLREENGLAMSSRNQYLSAGQRERAALIHHTLLGMAQAVRRGDALVQVERDAARTLGDAGFAVDYAAVRKAENLAEPEPGQRAGLAALIAARLGRARLIDNVLIGV